MLFLSLSRQDLINNQCFAVQIYLSKENKMSLNFIISRFKMKGFYGGVFVNSIYLKLQETIVTSHTMKQASPMVIPTKYKYVSYFGKQIYGG